MKRTVTLAITICAGAAVSLAADAAAGKTVSDKSCKSCYRASFNGKPLDDLVAYVRTIKK